MTKNHTSIKTIALAHGRSLALAGEDRSIRIADQNGVIELEIELCEAGPVVRVRAASLQVETSGVVALGCERFELHARDGIRLSSDGDLTASVAGDLDCRAAGLAHWEGNAVRVRAKRGEAQLEASDDVRIDGERVLLNS